MQKNKQYILKSLFFLSNTSEQKAACIEEVHNLTEENINYKIDYEVITTANSIRKSRRLE